MATYSEGRVTFADAPKPGQLYYDALLELAASGNAPRLPIVVGHLMGARIYVLTDDAVRCVAEAAALLGTRPYDLLPPPALPLWIEFEQGFLRDRTDWDTFALGIHPVAVDTGKTPLAGVDNSWLQVRLFRHNAPVSSLYYQPDSRAWKWEYTLKPCTSGCQLAALTTSTLASVVHSEQAMAADLGLACACWAEGNEWLRLIAVFFHLLSASGVEREVIVAPPITRSRRQQRHGATVARAKPLRYERVSLSHPKPQVVRRSEGKAEVVTPTADESTAWSRETRNKPYPRLLIAGPGSRWKKTQVVFVAASKPYRRRIVGNTIRYWVEA